MVHGKQEQSLLFRGTAVVLRGVANPSNIVRFCGVFFLWTVLCIILFPSSSVVLGAALVATDC